MTLKQIDEYFKSHPKLDKRYRKALEEKSPEFLLLYGDVQDKLKLNLENLILS